MKTLIHAPTLQIHGALDPCVLPRVARASEQYVAGHYEWRELPDTGHFPHVEAPELIAGEVLRWAKGV